MALIDSDGKITIDDDAAMADIQKAAEAEDILREAVKCLQNLISESEVYEGEMIDAIIEKAIQQKQMAERLIANLEETQEVTRRVVEHYKIIDQKCRDMLLG